MTTSQTNGSKSRWMIVPVIIFGFPLFIYANTPFDCLGDKPAETNETIPKGWEEVVFSPPLVKGTIMHQEDGIRLVAHNYLEPIMPRTEFETVPTQRGFSVMATPGEYEPFAFTLRNYGILRQIQVRLTELTNTDSSAVISAKHTEVRRVVFRARNNDFPFRLGMGSSFFPEKKYIRIPTLLVREDRHVLPVDENRTFWVTVHVPDNALPGVYNGQLVITGLKTSVNLPVQVYVLPFRLIDQPITFGMYYYYTFSDKELGEKELQDMANRGFKSLFIGDIGTLVFRDNQIRYMQNQNVCSLFDLMERMKIDHSAIFSLTPHFIYEDSISFTREGYDYARDPAQLVCLRKREADGTRIGSCIKQQISSHIPLVYNPIDEPEYKGRIFVAETRHRCQLFKTCLDTYETMAGRCVGLNTAPIYAPYLDIACYNVGGPEYSRAAERLGLSYWYYANGAIPDLCRFFWGQMGWAEKTRGINAWVYRSQGIDQSYRELELRYPRLYTYPSTNGPVPTIAWEALRQGVNDLRYLATLENLATANSATDTVPIKFLEQLRIMIGDTQYLHGGTIPFLAYENPVYFDKIRRLVIGHILLILGRKQYEAKSLQMKVPPFPGKITFQEGLEALQDTNMTTIGCSGSPWQTSGGPAMVLSITDFPDGRAVRITNTGTSEVWTTVTQEIQNRSEMEGKVVKVGLDLYASSDLLAVKVDLLQKDKAGKPVSTRLLGTEYGNAVADYTAIPEPGQWIRREISGKVMPDADKLCLQLTVRALNVIPEENGQSLCLRNISVKTVQAKMSVPDIDLESYSTFFTNIVPIQTTAHSPYPKLTIFKPQTGVPTNDSNRDISPRLLSDNVPAFEGDIVRTGVRAHGKAAALIDCKHDYAHAVDMPEKTSDSFVFDFGRTCVVSRLEIRGFNHKEWGYAVQPLEWRGMIGSNTVALTGKWKKVELDKAEPWETYDVFVLDGSPEVTGLQLFAPQSEFRRYLSEVFMYGDLINHDWQAQKSSNTNDYQYYQYPGDVPIFDNKNKIRIQSAVSDPEGKVPNGSDKLIDGNDSFWLVEKTSHAVIDFQLGKTQAVNGVEIQIGALNWSSKCQSRYLRFFRRYGDKWLAWGEPLVGNLAMMRALKMPTIETDAVRLEVEGTWAPYFMVIREVSFYGPCPSVDK